MKSQFVESTLVMVAVIVVLTAFLAVGGVLSGNQASGSTYVPVKIAGPAPASDSGTVTLGLGSGTAAPSQRPQVTKSTGNIIFGIAGV